MSIVELVGPRCAGKTYIAESVVQNYPDVGYFSLGRFTRGQIQNNTPLGRQMAAHIANCKYPGGFLIEPLTQELGRMNNEVIIVDGFPKSHEVEDLIRVAEGVQRTVAGLIEVNVQDNIAVERSKIRGYCPQCDKHYAALTVCPRCNIELSKRPEDDEVQLKCALIQYHANIAFLLARLEQYYPAMKVLRVDNSEPGRFRDAVEEITNFLGAL